MSIGGAGDFNISGSISVGFTGRGIEQAQAGLRSIERAGNAAIATVNRLGVALTSLGSKVTNLGAGLANVGKNLTLGVSIPALGLVASAVSQASDLNETVNLTTKIFGSATKQVLQWGTTTADQIGIAQSAALQAAGLFGDFFIKAGLTQEVAAKQGEKVVQIAADLASFFNTSPEQAIAAVTSGLSGEIEPLRKYHIFITEAAVAQVALQAGLVDSNGEISEQNKVLARWLLIQRQTTVAQGDFKDTSNDLANVLRRLKATFVDVKAGFGQLLLPDVLRGAKFFLSLLNSVKTLQPGMKRLVVLLVLAGAALGPFLIGLGFLASGFGVILQIIGALLLPLLLIGGALVGVGLILKTVFGIGFREAGAQLLKFGGFLVGVVLTGKVFNRFFFQLSPGLRNFARIVGEVVVALREMFLALAHGDFSGFVSLFTAGLRKLKDAFLNIDFAGLALIVLSGLVAVARAIGRGLLRLWTFDVNAYKRIGSGLIHLVKLGIDRLRSVDWAALVNRAIKLGKIILASIVELGGDLKDLKDDAGGFLRRVLGLTDDTEVDIGKLTVVGDIHFRQTGRQDPGKSFANQVADGIRGSALAVFDAMRFLVIQLPRIIGEGAGRVAAVAFQLGVALVAGIARAIVRDPLVVVKALAILLALAIGAPILFISIPFIIAGNFLIGFYNGLVAQFPTVGKFFNDLPDVILSYFEKATTWLIAAGYDVITGFIDGVSIRWNQFLHYLSDLTTNLPRDIGDLSNALFNTGYNLITGLINGVASRWNNFVHFLGDLVSSLPGYVKRLLGISSPSKVFAGIGANAADGFFKGFRDRWSSGLPGLGNSLDKLRIRGGGFDVPIGRAAGRGPSSAIATSTGRTIHVASISIPVSGAGDPATIAEHVFRKLDSAFQRLETAVAT